MTTRRSHLGNQIQKALRNPSTRPLPADPFQGFRVPQPLPSERPPYLYAGDDERPLVDSKPLPAPQDPDATIPLTPVDRATLATVPATLPSGYTRCWLCDGVGVVEVQLIHQASRTADIVFDPPSFKKCGACDGRGHIRNEE